MLRADVDGFAVWDVGITLRAGQLAGVCPEQRRWWTVVEQTKTLRTVGGVLFLCVILQVLTLAEEQLRVATYWSLGETRSKAMESVRAFILRGLTVLVAL